MNDNEFEIAIVGGGPAGITAALSAGRSRVRTIVLERGAVGVGRGTTRAMVYSSLAILIVNFFLTMFLSLIFPAGAAG